MLIYLFILSLEKNYFKVLYLLPTLCQNIRFKVQVLIESLWMQFLSLQFHLLWSWRYSFCSKDSHYGFEQTEFIQWQVYCLFISEIFATMDIIENCKKLKYWICFELHYMKFYSWIKHLIKQCSQLTSSHPRGTLEFMRKRCLGSLEKAGSYLFSVNIFSWLKQGLNLLDIIISLYPRICTELNNSACLNCQCYCFKSLQKQGVNCKFDNAVGYRNVVFKNIPQNSFSKWQD